MALDGSESNVDGRKHHLGIWVAPRGGAWLNVDLRGACVWVCLDPMAVASDIEYVKTLSRALGFTALLGWNLSKAVLTIDLG